MRRLFSILVLWMMCPVIYAGCCSGGGCCGPKVTKSKKRSKTRAQTTQKEPVRAVCDQGDATKQVIKQAYGQVAQEGVSCDLFGGGGCCGGGSDLSKYIGYTEEEIDALGDANLGLGCGNPVSLGKMRKGDTVIDLGSGAGFDCFIAAKKVGSAGKVIGVDMTQKMIDKARANAKKYGFDNVAFRLGDIESLPVADGAADIIISNCVINLAPDKSKVFNEAYRALKPGGKMFVSDVVLLDELSPAQKKDPKLLCACVGGALLKDDYVGKLERAGFDIEVVGEDTQINRTWFDDDQLPIASLKFVATKK